MHNRYDNDILDIDGKGKFIMPSLSDAHVHLPKEEKDLEKYLILNLINGVTKIRSMRGDWKHIKWKEKYNAENYYYPKMYLSPPPMHRSYEMNEDEINEYVMYSKEFDFIKILSIKDVKTFILLNKACKSNNIQLGGHYPTNIPDSLIFNSMYSSFEHLGGLTEPKSTDKIISKIKTKGCYITPTLSWYDVGSGKYSNS